MMTFTNTSKLILDMSLFDVIGLWSALYPSHNDKDRATEEPSRLYRTTWSHGRRDMKRIVNPGHGFIWREKSLIPKVQDGKVVRNMQRNKRFLELFVDTRRLLSNEGRRLYDARSDYAKRTDRMLSRVFKCDVRMCELRRRSEDHVNEWMEEVRQMLFKRYKNNISVNNVLPEEVTEEEIWKNVIREVRSRIRFVKEVYRVVLCAISTIRFRNLIYSDPEDLLGLIRWSQLWIRLTRIGLYSGSRDLAKFVKDSFNEKRFEIFTKGISPFQKSLLFNKDDGKCKKDIDRRGINIEYYFRGIFNKFISGKEALQLSYIGRALPEGDIEVQLKAMTSFINNITEPTENIPEDTEIMKRIDRFGYLWSKSNLFGGRLGMVKHSFSSSQGISRKDGGFNKFLVERNSEINYSEIVKKSQQARNINGLGEMDIGECDLDAYVRDVLLLEQSLDVVLNNISVGDFNLITHDALTISERGFKSRIVTKADNDLLLILHKLQNPLLAALMQDCRVMDVLKGDREEAIKSVFRDKRVKTFSENKKIRSRQMIVNDLVKGIPKSFRYRGNSIILSSDLESATDLIPSWLILSLVRGISRGWKDCPKWFLDVMNVTYRNYNIKVTIGDREKRLKMTNKTLYNEFIETMERRKFMGSEDEGFFIIPATRGALMGLPCNWVFLSLIHLFWVEEAYRASQLDYPGLKYRTVICGDDLLGFYPDSMIMNYNKILHRCGARLSKGKHFISRDYCNFTEILGKVCVAKNIVIEPRNFLKINQRYPFSDIIDYHRKFPELGYAKIRKRGSVVRVDEIVDVRILPYIPIKGLVRRGKDLKAGQVLCPDWPLYGSIVESVGMYNKDRLIRIRRLLKQDCEHIFTDARQWGFFPFLPRFLGGFGLPPLKGDPSRCAFPVFYRKYIAVCAYGSSYREKVELITKLWKQFSTSANYGSALEMAKERIEIVKLVSSRKKNIFPHGKQTIPVGELGNFIDRAVGGIERELNFMLINEFNEVLQLSPFILSNKIRVEVAKVVKSWPGVKGVSNGCPIRRIRDILSSKPFSAYISKKFVPSYGFGGSVLPISVLSLLHQVIPSYGGYQDSTVK